MDEYPFQTTVMYWADLAREIHDQDAAQALDTYAGAGEVTNSLLDALDRVRKVPVGNVAHAGQLHQFRQHVVAVSYKGKHGSLLC